MASLEDDVVSHIAFDLYGIRNEILESELPNLTPTQLVDKTITWTVAAIQNKFKLEAIGACESDGQPHYCVDIATYYWDIVNDTSGDV